MILLIGKERTFIVKEGEKFSSQYGIVDLKKVKIGKKIKSSTGHEFIIAKPSIIDLLKKCRRMPQIIMPKDAASIISITGIEENWKILDAGSGSGFLSLFLGSFLKSGKVYTYEKNEKFAENVKKNVELCGLEKIITVYNKDILKGFKEKNLDMATLDMIYAEKMVKKVHSALKPGGWIVIYSPHIEQQKKVREEMEKLFYGIKTIENIQRSWQVSEYTHPKPSGIMHTGFLTFGRKGL